MRNSLLVIIGSIIGVALIGCGNEPKNKSTALPGTSDSIRQDTNHFSPVIPSSKIIQPVDRKFNDIARFISGLKHEEGSEFAKLEQGTQWIKFAANFDEKWKKMDSLKITKYKSWSEAEMQDVHNYTSTLFYPFAGADVMHVYSLFPHAKRYIMVGLEPSGTVPDIQKEAKDSLHHYFSMINRALYNILDFSFFRTKSMAVDFHTRELDGTLPIMMVFLARTGNKIIDLKAAHYTEKGEVAYEKLTDLKKSNGVEISFVNEKTPHLLQKVYYFTVNLGDGSFSKGNVFKNFIEQADSVSTYLKSASYLMHKAYFSNIRNLILTQSRYVLQDDSGIAFRFFDKNEWSIQLYGSYDKPIPLFANMYQQDLKDAYGKDNVKPISFGIGYDYREGESNLILARKK